MSRPVTSAISGHTRDADCAGPTHALHAEVALLPALPGKDLLTYALTAAHAALVQPGMRVLVPLGRRHETGLVVGVSDAPALPRDDIRPIAEVLDSEPIITPEIFELCRWSARYYVTTLADVLATALPGGLRATTARHVRAVTDGPPARTVLESAIVAAVAGARDGLSLRQLTRTLDRPGVAQAVRTLAARGTVAVHEELRAPSGTTLHARILALARPLDDDERARLARRAPRQDALYRRIAAAPGTRLAEVALAAPERAAAGPLVARGVLVRLREERYRETREAAPVTPPPTLTAEQRVAVDTVAAQPSFGVFLLHGVTGSGKTEVYLELAARTLATGRSVLLLIPEIALTHQLLRQAQARLGASVALLHSGLGPGERWDEWRRIARGEARVVVGTRSAVFAPLAALGLVVVDEEHDAAYKQDEGLRYSARDLAVVRAKLAGAAAVLGSATPSVESYQQALDGKFRLLTLTQRVEGRPLPSVELIDMRLRSPTRRTSGVADAPRQPLPAPGAPAVPFTGVSSVFAPALLDAIATTLARSEQTLLFLNRRGFAQSLQCLACGEPAGCPACSVSLTVHHRRGVLLCHHCGHTRPVGTTCATCGAAELRTCGEGTERVEAEIARLFPAARLGRLDRDTTARRGAHQKILDAWRTGALDILIGTQMVAKGHDVPGVTLVGVLAADVALNLPDFRAAERAFQLLTQVAGRAGRGSVPGRVVVQTHRPTHHGLRAAAAHDYAGFAPRELALRREVGYPPFARLVVLRLEGRDPSATEKAARRLAAHAHSATPPAGLVVRGPAPAPLERLRGRYRWQLMLGSASVRDLHAAVRRLLAGWRTDGARTIRLVVDIDPVSML